MSRAEEVRAAVADHLGIEPELLTEQASLSEDLGLDSLAGIELATALEDRFSLRITDDELSA
ncbi:MAG TPA: phosphopantetheine-binding protein, partial [Mycobacteriales bacterium]|nr:phosphopantetheine-binding protein [Mycobacteriales bacterium]